MKLATSMATPTYIIQAPVLWPMRPASPVLGGRMAPPVAGPLPPEPALPALPTVTTPAMPWSAWRTQMKLKVPSDGNVRENVPTPPNGGAWLISALNSFEGSMFCDGFTVLNGSKSAGGGPARKVMVCGTPKSFFQTTVSPAPISIQIGRAHV